MLLELLFPLFLLELITKSSTIERNNAVYYLGFFGYVMGVFLLINNSLILSGILIVMLVLAKMPIYSLHTWLPKVHAEISIVGSMILARLILKVSYPMFLFMRGTYMIFLLVVMSLIAMISSLDRKTVVAYSSVLHMTLTVFLTLVLFMLGRLIHVVVSPIIFILVYVRYLMNGSRYYINSYLFLLILINFSFPLIRSFFCEVYILSYNRFGLIVVLGIFISSVFLLTKILFGSVNMNSSYLFILMLYIVLI